MKIEIESTTKTVTLDTPAGSVPARIWEGKTASGIPVVCFVTRIVPVTHDEDLSEFERELQEQRPPSPVIQGIDMRLIL